MRQRNRKDPPLSLQIRHEKWLKELQENPNADTGKAWRDFSKKDTTRSLKEMFNDKCCYCECQCLAGNLPHIEHFRPKKTFNTLCFDYNNLHIACPGCNLKKGDEFDDKLLSPSDDQPEEHLYFSDSEARGKTKRGTRTIEILGLNRTDYIKVRAQYLLEYKQRLEDIPQSDLSEDFKNYLLKEFNHIEENFHVDKPFSLMMQCAFAKKINRLKKQFE